MRDLIPIGLIGFILAGAPIFVIHGQEAQLGGKAPFFYVYTYNPERCGTQRVFLDQLVGKDIKNQGCAV